MADSGWGRRPSQAQQAVMFRRLIAALEPEVQRAFLAAWLDLYRHIHWPSFTLAIRTGNVDAAIAAMHIEPAAFEAYRASVVSAYIKGGELTAQTVNAPAGIVVRFDMTNPRAEAWIATDSSQQITRLTDEAKAVARQTILTGYQQGRNPNNIAIDLAGRVVGGRRQGGVLDLDAPRAERYLAVKRGMTTAEGVADLVIDGRDGPRVRYKVNPATEARIIKAWRRGEAVPQADRIISERQYHNALVKDRAVTVGRSETGRAVMAAKLEEWEQVLERLGAPETAVIKTWVHGGGPKEPRWWHVAMNGKSVRGLRTPFRMATGAVMQCAHDPKAPARETVRCTCGTNFRLDRSWNLD